MNGFNVLLLIDCKIYNLGKLMSSYITKNTSTIIQETYGIIIYSKLSRQTLLLLLYCYYYELTFIKGLTMCQALSLS